MRIADELQDLLEGGVRNSRFSTELTSLLRELREEWGRTPDEIEDELENADVTHSFLQAILGLTRWIQNREYQEGALVAIQELRESNNVATSEGWDRIALQFFVERIRLLSQLNHDEELGVVATEGIEYLKEQSESLPIGPVSSIIDAIIESGAHIENEELQELLLELVEDEASRALRTNQFADYRRFWRRSQEVRRDSNREITPATDAIIRSYNEQISFLKEREEYSLSSTFAHEAIEECVEWIDREQRVEWEQEYIEGNKKSIEQMPEFVHEPTDGEIEELNQQLENLVDTFAELKERENSIIAIKYVVNHDLFVPDIDQASEVSEGSVLNWVQSRTVTAAGESYAQGESGANWPQSYSMMVQYTQNLRQDVYQRLQNRELLAERDLFVLFNRREVLSSNTLSYITDFIIAFFDHRHPEAIHLGMAQLEAVVRQLVRANGYSILRLDSASGELQRRPLSGLLYQVESEIADDWRIYMQFWYTDLSGQNVRNKISHGYLPYRTANWGLSAILLFDILRAFLEFEIAFD